MKRNGRHGEHPYGDLGQIVCLILFLAVWIIDSFLLRLSTVLANYIPSYIQWIVASLIFGLAIVFVRFGHRVISEEVQSQPQLIKTHVFSHLRHPLYLSALLFYAGLFFITLSLISLGLLAGIFVFYDYIAAYEERRLVETFGQEYRDYQKKVPKWLPRFKPAKFD